MSAFCPNLSNKQVKQEFDELTNAVGENAAYYLWNKHEGNYELASQEATRIAKWNSDQLLEVIYPSELGKVFKDFLDRVAFDTKLDPSLIKPVIDVANKVFMIGEVNDATIAQSMAELGWALLDKYTQREIVKQYGKRVLLGGDVTDSIIHDLKTSIEKGVATNFEQSWFDKILSKLAEFIGKIYKNKFSYFNAIDNLAKSIAKNYDGYYDKLIQEGFEQKNITLEDIHSTEVGKVYDLLTSEKYGGTLGGSAAIRLQGTLYRQILEDFHDLDFTMPFSKFSFDLRTAISRFYDNIRMNKDIMGWKDASVNAREQLLKEVDVIFKRSELFEDLSKIYDEVALKNIFYTPGNGMCFTFTVDGFPVDLFFSKDVKPLIIEGIKVSHFSVSFAAKTLMRRPKDMRDIINFKKFKQNSNENKTLNVEIPESAGLNKISQQTLDDLFVISDGRLSANKLLSRMMNSSEFFNDKVQSEVSAQINKILGDEVTIDLVSDASYTAAFSMKNGKPTIHINYKAFQNLNTHDVGRAFLHEVVHYFTVHKYKTDEKFRNKIDKLHAELLSKVDKNLLKDPMYYGLKSSEEFITELFTNSAFRDFVVKNKSKSVWRRIVEAIAKILGIQPKVSKFLDSKMPSTVDKTIKEISNIINNFYSDPTISNYGDAIAYLSPTDPHYDALKKAADQIILKAKTGLNSRLGAMKHNKDATPAQVAKLKTQIERYENMLRAGEDQSVIIDFIKESSIVFKSTLDKIRSTYCNPDLMSNEEVWAMRSDIIEFYGPIIGQINSELLTPGYFEDLSLDDRKLLARRLHLIQAVYAEVKGKWKYIIQEKAKNIIRNYSEAYGIPKDVVEAYCDDFLNHTTKDIWFYGKFLQSTKSMDELSIRIMHRAMTDCNNQATRYANEKAHELIQVLMPVRRHWDDFYEKDKKNKRTGQLVRDRNYGQAMRELQTFLDKLDAKYGIKDRQYQLLEGDDYINYCVEKEKYIGDHFERRFKKEYYEAYAKLSLYAKEVLRGFNQEIDLITSPVTRNDGIHLEDLSDENYKKLLSLYREKRNLSNNFYEDGTYKVGQDLDLALELQEFEKVTKGGIFSKQLTQEEVLSIIEEKKSILTEEQFKKWYDRNVTVAYSESFTQLLKLNSKDRIEEYQELLDIRSQLLRYGRNSKNPYVAAGLLTESAKAEILDIDNALEDFRADLEEEGTTSSFKLSDFVKFETTQEYERDKAAASAAGPDAYREWYNRSHTSKGRPASYYTKMIPINPDHFEVRLNRMNRELSENSPLYNPDYDSSSSEHYQPKRSLYDNSKAFDKIRNNPEMQRAYDYILDLMQELNSKINYLENANNYKLPQISGDLYDHVVKGKNWKGIFHYIDDSTAVRSDDEQYALENYTVRADGSQLDFVPTPYVSNLTRPEYISSNLVGILTEYARMAENFRIKNDAKGDFLVLEEILKQRDFVEVNEITGAKTLKSGDKTRTYDRAHSFLEMQLWNRFKKPIFNSTNKYLLRFTQVMHILKDHATKQNLSWNALTIIKSFFQGQYKSIVEALAGRYLDTAHYFYFMAQSWLTLPVQLWNLSRPTTNNFDIALLHHNQISRETKSLTENLQYNRLVRGIKSNIIWGGWSFIDYMTKLPVVKSVYANFKYDPVSNTFMARHQYINKYYGDDRAAGKRAFKRLKIRAIDAITSKDGIIVMKDRYKHLSHAFFNPNVQNSLRNISKFLTNRIDGMLSPEDKTQIMTDSVLSWAFMHRGFWVNNLEDNYMANRQYNPMLEDEYEAKYQSLFRPLWLMAKNLIIAGQNTMRRAAGRTDLKLYHTFNPDSVWRYNVSKVLLQWGGIILISILLSSWLKEKADEAEDNRFVQTAATALEGMVNEEVAEYPSPQFLNQVSNFSPGISPMQNWLNLGVAIANWGSSTDEFNIYESGAYEGLKPIHRSLIRVTPGLKGLIESKDIRSRKRYIEKNKAGVIQWFYTDEFNAEDDWDSDSYEQHVENADEYKQQYNNAQN